MSAQPDYQHPEPDPAEVADIASSAIEETVAATAVLSTEVPALLEVVDDLAAVRLLRDLRAARVALAEVESYAETALARRLGKGKHPIPGFQVEVKGGTRWTEWRHDSLAFDLCRDIAVDPDTAELNEDVLPIIDQVRSRLLNACRPDWRTTVLRQHGLSPNDYATWTASRRTVQITPDAEATP